MLHKSIQKVIVLSLVEDRQRREHIRRHFPETGIDKFDFFQAIPSSSPRVIDFYRKNLVQTYPSCFRCGLKSCQCPNNIIIPQQVANWLSFIDIWKSIAGKDGLFLICEDDIGFHKNAIPLLNGILTKLSKVNQRLLIRLVASGQQPFKTLELDRPLEIVDKPAMSNAAYIISGGMASYLLEQFKSICHTSDVWLHQHIAGHDEVKAITVNPLIGTDLSFNKDYAQFLSRIHPKGIDEEDVQRAEKHKKRVNTVQEYNELLREWKVN